jgi:hypothetical protein
LRYKTRRLAGRAKTALSHFISSMVVPNTLPSSFLAASWQKHGSIDLIKKDMPAIQPGNILVKVAASGLCGKLDYQSFCYMI